ncbi:MAG TPA: hypothetical protein VF011_13895 [Terriglobales bacterium]
MMLFGGLHDPNQLLGDTWIYPGCPIPRDNGDEQSCEPDLTFEVTQPELTRAYDRQAGVEYVFAVRITNRSYGRLQVQYFNARVPWRRRLYWPGVPGDSTRERPVYRFESGRTFSPVEVLNHRVRERFRLNPGESWEGLLLAYSVFDSIPKYFLHGELYDVRLSAVDQYGRWHWSYIEMLIDRTATMPALSIRRPGKGLFEKAECEINCFPSRAVSTPRPAEPQGNERVPKTAPPKEDEISKIQAQ